MLKPVEKIEIPQPDSRFVTRDYSQTKEGDIIVIEKKVGCPYSFRGSDTFWVTAQVMRATKTQRTLLSFGRETVVTLKGKIIGAGPYDHLPRLTEEGQKEFDHTASDYAYVRLSRLRDRVRGILREGSLGDGGSATVYLRRAANKGIVDEELMGAVERVAEILKQREQETGDEPK